MRLPTNLAAGLSLGWTGAFHRRRVSGRLQEDHKVCEMNDHIGRTWQNGISNYFHGLLSDMQRCYFHVVRLFHTNTMQVNKQHLSFLR